MKHIFILYPWVVIVFQIPEDQSNRKSRLPELEYITSATSNIFNWICEWEVCYKEKKPQLYYLELICFLYKNMKV